MAKLLTIGDLLKSEADVNSRIAIPAPVGTKIGQLVKYGVRDQYLVALSDEEHGKVLVQPHNCVIDLDNVALADITALHGDTDGLVPLTADTLIREGDTHGIKFIGTPYSG